MKTGDLRDRVDLISATRDHARAAQAGGPKVMAHEFGRPRGSDRFPTRRPIRRRAAAKKR